MQRSFNAPWYSAAGFLGEPGPPHGHRSADMGRTMVGEGGFADMGGSTAELGQPGGRQMQEISEDILATDPSDYVLWASAGEPAPCKVDDIMDGGGLLDGSAVVKSS